MGLLILILGPEHYYHQILPLYMTIAANLKNVKYNADKNKNKNYLYYNNLEISVFPNEYLLKWKYIIVV